jgi:hypothetical protein
LQNNVLARMAAAQRLLMQPEDEALETALRYSLVTEQTNLLLVHVREQAEKTTTVPGVEQIKQMMAAGHSGYGSARSAILQCREPSAAMPIMFRMGPSDEQLSPVALVQAFNALALKHQTCGEALEKLAALATGEDLRQIIAYLENQLGSESEALVILLLWVARFRELENCALEPFAAQLLEDELQTMDQDLAWEAFRFLEETPLADH